MRGQLAWAIGPLWLGLSVIGSVGPAQAAEDPKDTRFVHTIVNQLLETERSKVETPWSNPVTGSSGTIVIIRTFYREEGGAEASRVPCRNYLRTLNQRGSGELVTRGVGCRKGPSRWELDEEPLTEARAAPAAGPERRSTPQPPQPEPTPPPPAPVAQAEPAPAPAPAPASTPAPAASSAPGAAGDDAAVVEMPDFTMPSRSIF